MPSIYKKLKKSDRKFIRREKSRIRREFLSFKKQEEMISELYKKMLGKPEVVQVKEAKEVKEDKKDKSVIKEVKKGSDKKVKAVKKPSKK